MFLNTHSNQWFCHQCIITAKALCLYSSINENIFGEKNLACSWYIAYMHKYLTTQIANQIAFTFNHFADTFVQSYFWKENRSSWTNKKRCYGTCNSDTMYPESLVNGVSFASNLKMQVLNQIQHEQLHFWMII